VTSPTEQFLSYQDLAERWSVSVKTVRRIVARGEIKVHRIGHQVRVLPQDAVTYEKLHRS
jgi:excisionase family DNA binding protein